MADLFKENGYRTVMIGKWHLGMSFSKTPDFQEVPDFDACSGVDYKGRIARSPVSNGFDYYYGISGSLDMPPYVYIENDYFTEVPDHETESKGKKFWRKGPTGAHFHHENVLDELTEKVTQEIENNKDGETPFFIYFPMPAPHTPILPGKEFQGKSGTNEYGDFVLHCDDVVGRVTEKLKETGLYDNTIVIYTSDNGCSPMADYKELKEKGHNPSYVFRGTKSDIYEGGHRIPLIVQWPEELKGGKVCEKIVCLSDFMATMAEILGVSLPDNCGEDSVSNLPLWKEPEGDEVRKDIVHQSIDGSLSIRRGNFKLEMCQGSGGWSEPVSGTKDESLPRFQLYDLSDDIGERKNVIEEHKELAGELRNILKSYVENGRSTPGEPQSNNGQRIWETVSWLDEDEPLKLNF